MAENQPRVSRLARILRTRSVALLAAELVLIIAGVLAALWVDAWAAARTDRRTELSYLERLLDDLRSDSVSLGRAVLRSEQAHHALNRLAVRLRGPTELEDAGQFFWDLAIARGYYEGTIAAGSLPRRATYDEMLATGRIALISDTNVRRWIGNYYHLASDLERLDALFEPVTVEFLRSVRGATPVEVVQWFEAGSVTLADAREAGLDAAVIDDRRAAAESLERLRSDESLLPLVNEMARIQSRMEHEYRFVLRFAGIATEHITRATTESPAASPRATRGQP